MRFYKVTNRTTGYIHYFATKVEAGNQGHEMQPRSETAIDEIEVATDKAGMTKVINGEIEAVVIRSWFITPRGRMKLEGNENPDLVFRKIPKPPPREHSTGHVEILPHSGKYLFEGDS